MNRCAGIFLKKMFNKHNLSYKDRCFVRFRTRLSKLQKRLSDPEEAGLFNFISSSRLENGLKLKIPDFNSTDECLDNIPYILQQELDGHGKLVYFETYGCQMNDSDTEVAWSILKAYGYKRVMKPDFCDIALLMTCAVREGAESTVYKKLKQLKAFKKRRMTYPEKPPYKIALLGCMAERLKSKLLDYSDGVVDIVCGPDALRDLPILISSVYGSSNNAVNVTLSLEETYSDIVPVRLDEKRKTAYISIMRGCDNMCTYCIIPFTRGRERSRPIKTILKEANNLIEQGVKEIVLVGQNVNSYRDLTEIVHCNTTNSEGFSTVYRNRRDGLRFDTLLDEISQLSPEVRIRFTAPHPKDFPDSFIQVMKDRHNICNQIHIPAQSGSSDVLKTMNRGYTRDAYLNLIDKLKSNIKGVVLSSDFIAGFCHETEENHKETMQLLKNVRYNHIYVFPYSMRQKTRAHYRLTDNVPLETKKRRHMELANLYREIALEDHSKNIGTTQLIMLEDVGKRSDDTFYGATEGGVRTIIQNNIEIYDESFIKMNDTNKLDYKVYPKPGDYIAVEITGATSQTYTAKPLYKTTLKEFHCRQL